MTSPRQKNQRRAFSLIEVMLALAVLSMSLVMLGQLVSLGFRSARQSQGLSEAHMLAETVMEGISLGLIQPDPVVDRNISMMTDLNTFTVEEDTEWVYSINWEPAPVEGLIMMMVQVRRAKAFSAAQSDAFQLVRWMRDPALITEELPDSSGGIPTESTTEGAF
ncbi:type II secretion system protein [Bremerella cremea]|uniref:Type II secretion system protein n=1 Tax=Bremerella cremea TaxID=1031537 RepID=A0A368KV73_9BACT|nr:type II secretion system protein [Bremerella cremea]RCS54330.1 type II secretion system protein [Bremerella cremea]